MSTLSHIDALARTLDQVGVGVFVIDESGRALLWNQALVQCLPAETGMLREGEPAPAAILRALQDAHAADPQEGLTSTGSVGSVEFAVATLFGTGRFSVWRRAAEDETPGTVLALLEANRRLQALALIDPLTEIGNRRALDQWLASECRRACRANAPVSLLLLDIDNFKDVNDRGGHAAGDRVLRDIAALLQRRCRRPGDHCARYGGDEFVLLLPGTAGADAVRIAESVRAEVEQRTVGRAARMTVSLGIVCEAVPRHPDRLIEVADRALYEAKARGRNCVVLAGGAALPAMRFAGAP